MAETPVLRTIALGKRYGKRWAVRNLELTVRPGEVFGFLGPNGAGKSTTIRMALSLVAPTTGRVELFGKPLAGNRHEALARIGGLVERPDFYLYLSARRNLEIVAGLRGGVPKREIDEVLSTVGLENRADDRVKTFSHGMKQRLGIAQALLGHPELVILDEPTTGLDPQGIKQVRELIRRLSSTEGMTVFLSSHLLHEIEQTATSMAIINHGELVVQGNVRDLVYEREPVFRIDVDVPEKAVTLLGALKYVKEVVRDGSTIEARIPQERAAEVNRLLVDCSVGVRAYAPKRSLEEFFLAITEGATADERCRRRSS
jgi:ABC-type multidrug transport system ATPase subunit